MILPPRIRPRSRGSRVDVALVQILAVLVIAALVLAAWRVG